MTLVDILTHLNPTQEDEHFLPNQVEADQPHTSIFSSMSYTIFGLHSNWSHPISMCRYKLSLALHFWGGVEYSILKSDLVWFADSCWLFSAENPQVLQYVWLNNILTHMLKWRRWGKPNRHCSAWFQGANFQSMALYFSNDHIFFSLVFFVSNRLISAKKCLLNSKCPMNKYSKFSNATKIICIYMMLSLI